MNRKQEIPALKREGILIFDIDEERGIALYGFFLAQGFVPYLVDKIVSLLPGGATVVYLADYEKRYWGVCDIFWGNFRVALVIGDPREIEPVSEEESDENSEGESDPSRERPTGIPTPELVHILYNNGVLSIASDQDMDTNRKLMELEGVIGATTATGDIDLFERDWSAIIGLCGLSHPSEFIL